MIWRVGLWWLACGLMAATAAAQPHPRYAGWPLTDVLTSLQARGLNVVFSSELVKPDMRVATEPKATTPRKILDEVLEAHKLRVVRGVNGAWLVVRAPPGKERRTEGPSLETGAIRGKVVDKRTGGPLPGVTVRVQTTGVITVTGDDGTFAFDGVPAEPQTLIVSIIGYGLARPTLNVSPQRTTALTIALADGLGSYAEEVTVVGDRFRGADPAVPSQQTLTNADIQDLRGVVADDPLRAVQALPSVATGDDYRSEFSVRASDFRHIGLSLDGVPIGWPVHLTRGIDDTGSVSIVNGDILDRATLLSGPYPQRTTGRTGAWLSFDLQEGSRTATQGHLSVSGTTSSISVNGPFGSGRRGSWLISARQSYLQWILSRINASGGTAFGFSDVVAKAVVDPTPRHQLQFTAVTGRAKLDQKSDAPGPNSLGASLNHTSVAAVAWRWSLSKLLLTQRLAGMHGDFTNTGQLGQPTGNGRESAGWYLADFRVDLGHGALLNAGGTVERRRLAHTLKLYSPGATSRSTVLRQERTLAASAWISEGHVGLTWQGASGQTFDGGVGLSRSSGVDRAPGSAWALGSWPIAGKFSLRGGASVSRQFPDVAQIAEYGGGAPIQPERGVNVEAGIERRVSPVLRWHVAVFNRGERDVFRLDDSEPRVVADLLVEAAASPTWRNALTGYARGVEVMLQRRAATKVAGWVSYSYGRAQQTDDAKRESFWTDFDQRHAVNAYALYRFTPKTSLSGKLRLGSNFPLAGYFTQSGSQLFIGQDRNTERLPFYSRLDLRWNHTFTYRKRRLSLFAEVINVLGHDNYGPTNGFVRADGLAIGFTERLMPFLPSIGLVFDF